MSITLKELADYLGLSIGTISRALNDDPKIAGSTRKKVKDLASKLEYVPSNLGRGLQSKKSFLVGYLVSNIKDSFYYEILQGIAQEAQRRGYGLLVGVTEENTVSELEQLRFFREKSVDGIIISNYTKETIPTIIRLREAGLPVVICDFENFDSSIPVIVLDENHAMKLLVDYLINLNHRQFAFYYQINANSLKRYTIVSDLLHQAGLPKPYLCTGKIHLAELMNQNDPPTAIISYSDLFAIEAIQTLTESGIKVPEDVSVTGFDDLLYAQWPPYSLTTIYQPKTRIGELSAATVIEMITIKQTVLPEPIEPQLIIRKSCAKIGK
jgi:DNA-binding LacI/PurR family transcriptional regulator